jgi:hypothetical protein
VLLWRADRDVWSHACHYREVEHVRVDRSLLRGEIELGLPTGPFSIRYNTVSHDLMLRLVDIIRERYGPASAPPIVATDGTPPASGLSFYFRGLLASHASRPGAMRLVASQATVAVRSRGMSAVRQVIFGIAGKRLLEAVHMTDGRELMIVDRGRGYAYRWDAVYDVDTRWIPLANIRGLAWAVDAGNAAVDLHLRTGVGTSVHVFAIDNPSIGAYDAFLSALPNVTRADGRAPSLPRAA